MNIDAIYSLKAAAHVQEFASLFARNLSRVPDFSPNMDYMQLDINYPLSDINVLLTVTHRNMSTFTLTRSFALRSHPTAGLWTNICPTYRGKLNCIAGNLFFNISGFHLGFNFNESRGCMVIYFLRPELEKGSPMHFTYTRKN